ncbi:fimbrial biogenesis outer membrane usher protein [Aureimonas sp. SA4125]|uniref:fimbria/pilus outer membrane usher protein n=1 Tax=Aureimonas sp. SA4125 TaxID=2826993 RepID=UPI001CC6BC63|nr:fimbria/pilus outer membrane usher protein [Aureimonas sp. SA4125]BDA85917.1 fimbrial biogenesis outer membrane usher protein [Aureimonas sp. SA4125]
MSSSLYRSLLTLVVTFCMSQPTPLSAQTADVTAASSAAPDTRALFLDVSVNGAPTGLVAAFEQTGGVLIADAEELRSVGILPAEAARLPDGRIAVDRLPGVGYGYQEATQSIDFTAGDDQRVAAPIDLQGARSALGAKDDPAVQPQSSYGALLNYSLFAASPSARLRDVASFNGASGSFEGRMFSPYGVVAQTFVASTDAEGLYETKRLETNWTYSDPQSMRTLRVGDLITGGLDWTRPTRLAGVQIQRNFSLRSDLVTLPIPEISGSAAVPSTVDVYLNGTRRFSKEVAAGPFALTNLPVVTGAGTARVVVRDAAGKESVSETSFFSSPKLLAAGLYDYSAELGFGRQFFGARSNSYDPRPMGSASVRYGFSRWLTVEGHAEGGADIANGGLGAVLAVGNFGTVSASASASRSDAFGTGAQLTVTGDTKIGAANITGRIQRSFDHYQDIASIIDAAALRDDNGLHLVSRGPAAAIHQVAVSLPLAFDPSSVSLSFTQVERVDAPSESVVGLSYSRNIRKTGAFYLSGYADLETRAFGVSAGLTLPLGGSYSSSLSVHDFGDGPVASASLSRRGGRAAGDYSWTLRDAEGETSSRSATGRYHTSFADFAGGVGQSGDRFRATAQMDGALIAAGGDVFFTRPVEDAFAIVDVGVADVAVAQENRPVGRTNARGKLVLPHLRAYEKNRISIEPADLPLDTALNTTRQIVVPADRSGLVVAFDAAGKGSAALVSFRDEKGQALPLGASGRLGADGEAFTIGYDGQAYVDGLAATNDVLIDLPDGGNCVASFAYRSEDGAQVAIPDAVCRNVG